MPNSNQRIRDMLIFSILAAGLIFSTLSGCQPLFSQNLVTPPQVTELTEAKEAAKPTVPAATSTRAAPLVTKTPTETEPASCLENKGRLEMHQFESRIVGKSQRVNVYLPPCYDPENKDGYPLLFMLHGQGQNENFWVDAGIAESSDAMILSGEASPFLVVMPYEEYNTGDILQSNFREMFIEELIPWVEDNLAVDQDYRQRAIGGNSRGAYWAFRLAFKYPGQFGAVGVHSIPFFGEPNALRFWIEAIPVGELPLVYLDTGDQDRYVSDALSFRALLKLYEIPHEWHLNTGEHDTAYWQENLGSYLRWYAQSWKMEANR
jgi:enterochelin esterase-like enzyme